MRLGQEPSSLPVDYTSIHPTPWTTQARLTLLPTSDIPLPRGMKEMDTVISSRIQVSGSHRMCSFAVLVHIRSTDIVLESNLKLTSPPVSLHSRLSSQTSCPAVTGE